MSIDELESKCIEGKEWRYRAPAQVRDLAIMAASSQPTALGYVKEFGWYVLQVHNKYGRYIVWTEKNFDKRPM